MPEQTNSEIKCAVDIGEHIAPYWLEKNSNMTVCARHRMQYEERIDEFGPYNWKNIPICLTCGAIESDMWWKCCPEHTTGQGIDVVCTDCRARLHPPKLYMFDQFKFEGE